MIMLKDEKDAVTINDLSQKIGHLLRNLWEERETMHYQRFKIKRIGRYLIGTGFFHETNEHYKEVGFEIEFEYQREQMTQPKTVVRFCPIWTDQTHSYYAPIDFIDTHATFGKSLTFNSDGDYFEMEAQLASQTKVENLVKKLCQDYCNGGTINQLMEKTKQLADERELES